VIGFNFDISNLFSDRFNCVYIKAGKTWFAHKFWELGIYENNSIISLNFSIKVREDHPGFYFCCALFGWGIDFEFYDSRHNGHSSN
jgi:hypothetical protein